MPISLPAVRYLLAIGFHHVRQVGRYGWLYAANAALNLLDGAVAGHAAKLLTGFTGVVLLLVATRQILTGNVTFGPRDILASLRLLGLLILSMLPIMAVYGGLTFAAGARALTYPSLRFRSSRCFTF
jgi:hypothetical protein